jgi:antitoxin HicB
MTTSFSGTWLIFDGPWRSYPPGTCYSVPVRLARERGGGYSVIVPVLPGCASQGDTVAEALANVREALAAAIECYQAHNEPIPWKPLRGDRRARNLRRVVVEVGGD